MRLYNRLTQDALKGSVRSMGHKDKTIEDCDLPSVITFAKLLLTALELELFS